MPPNKQESTSNSLEPFRKYIKRRKQSPNTAIALPAPYEDALVHENSFPEDAESQGFDRELALRATTEFNRADIEKFSLVLLAELIRRESAYTTDTAATRTKKVIPLSFIDYAICALLRTCADSGEPPPADLYALVIARFNIEGAPRKKQHLMIHNRQWAEIEMWKLLWDGVEPGPLRTFAKRAKVSASTITRWFGVGGFEKSLAEMRKKLKRTKS